MEGKPGKGISDSDRQQLLDKIETVLGDSPKARLVREIVAGFPRLEDPGEDGKPSA